MAPALIQVTPPIVLRVGSTLSEGIPAPASAPTPLESGTATTTSAPRKKTHPKKRSEVEKIPAKSKLERTGPSTEEEAPVPLEEQHVQIWVPSDCRKISGRAAPKRKRLPEYLEKHPDYEVYVDQDTHLENEISEENQHAAIWHKTQHRKVTGNAAPLLKRLHKYLAEHPEWEEYKGQDGRVDKKTRRRLNVKKRRKKNPVESNASPNEGTEPVCREDIPSAGSVPVGTVEMHDGASDKTEISANPVETDIEPGQESIAPEFIWNGPDIVSLADQEYSVSELQDIFSGIAEVDHLPEREWFPDLVKDFKAAVANSQY